jgi:carboxyl-terminal processing protease
LIKRMKIKVYCTSIICAVFLCLFLSCGSDSGSNSTNSGLVVAGSIDYTAEECSVSGQNEFVYQVMNDTYLWYDNVPSVDPSQFDSPEELLENIRYSELDRWSYITDQEEYNNYYEEGRYIGFGFSMLDTGVEIRVRYVFQDSPADREGMERGDRIISVNGKTVEDIEAAAEWDTIFGEDEVGVQATLQVEKPDSSQINITLEKEWVDINTILYHSILERNEVKVGYIVFNSFLMTSLDELTPVFTLFKNEGVTELVLDMRYNGGGRTLVAKYLADLIGGRNTEGNIFQKFVHNEKYSDWNSAVRFSAYSISLDLDRVIVITTGNTASASEVVINGLSPFIDVVIIGDTTSGKPVGMYGHDFCDKHISIIEFKVANADDESDYFNGIPPDCIAADDISMQFGDVLEDSLEEALNYIERGECSEGRSYASASRQVLTNNQKTRKKVRQYGLKDEIGAF